MNYLFFASYFLLPIISGALSTTEDPLSYRNIAGGYVTPKSKNTTTLLEFINSRSDLSVLAEELQNIGGFPTAFDTEPTWSFTFFAPNNDAFELHTGTYFNKFKSTPKGKWWLGNTLLSHYVPNTNLNSSSFNETYQRFQTASYLYVGSQVQDGEIILNNVATVVEKDISITKGAIHIIDRILDPSAQIFETDLPKVSQSFIPGSCSNQELSYC
ncbi:FAS1 domain-containing protein [Aspergillus japonicus CBS 114.51]|uniref:FAS1 domain-containing protein n=1 Tax=Aspergillus japonicus CBS 114.51 TaxID=1448312 RepID=A0A8T8WUM3_ASPJA|nr:FAS1 domain-containing protein [Aspergillus japonicus CBS 114.51]RAH79152.1 FAS1 domain-containing protein [Aspergillus japonicus CBS 114.51]